ncbi:MAG: tetratricopeptide repeat protein [Candidatus Zixiibacteriota bacterium]
MKTIVLIFFLLLVLLSVAAVLLMLVSALSRALRRKTNKTRTEIRTRIFPDRMLAEYYGGIRKTASPKTTELFEKGLSHKRKGKFHPAVKIFEECLNDNPTQKHKTGILVTLGNCHFALQELNRARDYYKKAETLSIESDDYNGRLACMVNLGLICAADKRWSEAIENYHRVIELDRKMNYLSGEAIDLNTLGLLCQNKGDPKSALRHYEQSLTLFERLKDHKKAQLVEDNIRRLENLDSM